MPTQSVNNWHNYFTLYKAYISENYTLLPVYVSFHSQLNGSYQLWGKETYTDNRVFVWVWIALRMCVSAFCWKMVGLMALFTDPQKSSKHKFQYKFESYSTIHTFKNYFVTVFSVFNNKWYLNRPFLLH